jgi:N-acetyl-1-D-myo-inositol-2-amino-2-deoxy-alpha-D-glucopyranoside deacetylase
MFPIPSAAGPLVRVQVVVAHPGDETFGCGSLLLHAAAAGAITAVTCATRGESLKVRPGVRVGPAGLGALREGELRTAAALLGVRRVQLLGFRDSRADGDPGPGALAAAELSAVLEAVGADVDAFRPDVLVTPDAADGERDHARIRAVTLEVAAQRRLPVYLVCPCPSATDGRTEATSTLDTHEHLQDRWAAIRAHHSQVSPFEEMSDDRARECLGSERLRRVGAPVAGAATVSRP